MIIPPRYPNPGGSVSGAGLVFRLLLGVVFLVGLIYALLAPVDTEEQAEAPLKILFANCDWEGQIQVWHDQDGNERMDPGEPLLEDVRVVLYDAAADSQTPVAETRTDAHGFALLDIELPGCTFANFELLVEAPAGFRERGRQPAGVGGRIQIGFRN